MNNVAYIEFTSCTDYGDNGRIATLRDASGVCIGYGDGGDDFEAVMNAVVGATGLSYGKASDMMQEILATVTDRRYGAGVTVSN